MKPKANTQSSVNRSPEAALCLAGMTTFAREPRYEVPIGTILDARPTTPFAHPVWNWPGETIFAMCLPVERCDRDARYLLSDGFVVTAMTGPLSVNDGSGWKPVKPEQFEAKVIGRVISLYRLHSNGWHELGAGWTE